MQFEEDFFKPEVKNDFKITSMMKRAWAAEMEVLEAVIDVCKKIILSILQIGEQCLEQLDIKDSYHGTMILIYVCFVKIIINW